MAEQKIKVAVIGGGVGGLCCAIGLLKQPHLDVQIYEAAHHFSEIGAGVAIGPNAIRALKLIGENTEQAFQNQATKNGSPEHSNTWFEFRYGMGEREGELIAAPKNEQGQTTVHRARFLEEFVKLVPSEIAHFGKRLVKMEELNDGRIKLEFKEGEPTYADCVVGADGVHSVVRKHILGPDHPSLDPIFTGSVAYRGLIPMEKAIEKIGETYAQNSYNWVGHGGVVMTYPIDSGKTMNIVAINSEFKNWEGPWVQKADYAKLSEMFKAWGPHARSIVELLDNADTMAWSMWDLPTQPTYLKNRICMLGDAAHASTPFQGQGAGQAIEDAWVLSEVLGKIKTPQQVEYAFKAYDKIRRPRSQKVIQTSREAGELNALRLPGVGDNAKAFEENISWRMDWMWHRDIALEATQAIMVYEKLAKGENVD